MKILKQFQFLSKKTRFSENVYSFNIVLYTICCTLFNIRFIQSIKSKEFILIYNNIFRRSLGINEM